jgi:sugar phosphate isomerase/epimerase
VKRSIGLAALTALELPSEELISVAAEAGYDCVGLRLIPVAGQPYMHPLNVPAIEKRLADTGLRVLDVEVFRLDPTTELAAFEPTLEICQRLGATDLLSHGADPDEKRLADTVARFSELAARYGLHVNIEPMPWVDISTVSKARRVLSKSNSAVLVDAIHFFRAENSFADLKDLPARYIQLCDARAERPSDVQEIIRQARGDRLMPGDGGLDLSGLLRALPPDLPLSLEIPYAKPMDPLARAKLALERTRAFLAATAAAR